MLGPEPIGAGVFDRGSAAGGAVETPWSDCPEGKRDCPVVAIRGAAQALLPGVNAKIPTITTVANKVTSAPRPERWFLVSLSEEWFRAPPRHRSLPQYD